MADTQERITQILEILKIRTTTTVRELSVALGVSEMTIRRDLARLASENYVKLFHGGVRYNRASVATQSLEEEADNFYLLSNEENMMVNQKQRIAKKAASLIQPNDVILLDTGSTTELVSEYIPTDIPVTVVCYTFNIMLRVYRRNSLKLILGGGYFHPNNMMFESSENVQLIKRNRVNKAFLSARGVSERLGVTTAEQTEINLKQAALQVSQERILLVDSSKFGKVYSAYYAELKDFTTVITDDGISQEYQKLIADLGLKLLLV
jgi:DeoR family deoxyribose operon repressor